MRDRLMVGQQILDLLILVRIQAPQPFVAIAPQSLRPHTYQGLRPE